MLFIALDDTVCPPELTERIVAAANNPYVVRQENMGTISDIPEGV